MSKNKRIHKKSIVFLRNIYGRTVLIVFFIWFAYIGIKRLARNRALKSDSVKISALIINEKNYLPNSDVSHEFSYSYAFIVGGKEFKGNSLDTDFKVGDSIAVEYSASNPNYNRPLVKNKK